MCCCKFFRALALCLALFSLEVSADDFERLARRCASNVSVDTLRAIVKTESGFNPYAIAVVGGKSLQPKTFQEAMIAIARLEQEGANYSVGLAQINRSNFEKYGVSAADLLDACSNLQTAAKILTSCYEKASLNSESDQKKTLSDALSCYYSGNFKTGYRHGYVSKVFKHAGVSVAATSIPSITQISQQLNERRRSSVRSSEPQLIF